METGIADGLARLRDKVDLPICADESVFDDKDTGQISERALADTEYQPAKSGGNTALASMPWPKMLKP